MGLRDEHVERTREKILEAVVAILARDVSDLSVQAVARESGISRPTIYRHFPGKRAMIAAVGDAYAKKLGVDQRSFPRDLEALLREVPAVFARSEALDDTFRAASWSTLGRRHHHGKEGRARRLADMRAVLAPAARGLAERDREQLARVSTVLCSSATRRAFRDVLGLGPEEAADCVTWAIRRLTAKGGPA